MATDFARPTARVRGGSAVTSTSSVSDAKPVELRVDLTMADARGGPPNQTPTTRKAIARIRTDRQPRIGQPTPTKPRRARASSAVVRSS